MAGDWIKVEHTTPDKPEVIAIADRLGIDQDAVFGKLVRLWIWADQQTVDGNASVTLSALPKSFIDRTTRVTGFADAVADVGWLCPIDGGFAFPNFDKHNGQTAKQRAVTSKRVATHRKRKCNAASVTQALPEKRREEYITPTPLDAVKYPDGFDTPAVRQALTDWLAYKATRRETYKQPAKQLSLLLGEDWQTPAAFVAAVKRSMARNYQGVFADRPNGKPESKPRLDDELPLRN